MDHLKTNGNQKVRGVPLWGSWILLLCLATSLHAADWPTHRNNVERTAVSSETLAFPLKNAWIYRAVQAPRPAWPEPGRAMNSLDFDYAFQPVIAGGIVYFASSADDTLRALDAGTGKLLWSRTTGGPIRFAPQISGGRCFFGSDDGFIYCLDARTGKDVWQIRGGIDPRQSIAEGRLCSRWPCRSGVLVSDNIVYAVAGMWPSEGVFVYSLDAATGREIWCNDTSSNNYLEYPHMPSASFGGPAPQGYLLLAKNMLIVPTGRSAPAVYDARSGRLLHYNADSGNRGGTYGMVVGENLFVSAVAWQPDQHIRLGESTTHRADSIATFTLNGFKEFWPYSAAVKSITDNTKSAHWRSEVTQGIFGRQRAVFSDHRFYAMGNGKANAFEFNGEKDVREVWSIDQERVYTEALAQNTLLLGESGILQALDISDGKVLWKADVEGQVRGIAIADGRVVISTGSGILYCFDSKGSAASELEIKPPVARLGKPTAEWPEILARIPDVEMMNGFAVVVGTPDAELSRALAEHSGLHVACVLSNSDTVRSERERLVAQSALYGSKVSIHETLRQNGHKLPFVSTFANLVVVCGDAGGIGIDELHRVLRPCGGRMCFVADAALPAETPILKAEIKGEGKLAVVTRGKLTGAFDWDSTSEADERVRWPLEFQWFGEPGPQLVQSRHTRPRTPISANGRMFIFGECHLSAVDAYNGTNLWTRRISKTVCSGTCIVSANDTSLFINLGLYIAELDAQSGRLVCVYGSNEAAPPVHDGTQPLHFKTESRQGSSGDIDIDASGDTLKVTLTSRSNTPSADDVWELAFDFRKPAERTAAPGTGTFEVIVNAWPGTLRPFPTFKHPPVHVEQKNVAGSGESVVQLSINWADIEHLAGWRPKNFALAADLKLWTEDFHEKIWALPLVGKKNAALNEAESIILVSKETSAEAARDAKPLSPWLPVRLENLDSVPAVARKEGRLPYMTRHRIDESINADFKEGLREAADPTAAVENSVLRRAKGFELLTRTQPFTAEMGPREYTRSYGCSGTSSSAVMDFFRSGTIGMYDRLDDSGMRNIGGIRSGCGLTLLPSQGLLLYSESAADCLCSYSFNTSLGMAPAAMRKNEDWALFDDRNLTLGQIRQSAINFGAAGDRRDESGLLWLTYPRPEIALTKHNTLQLPYHLETAPGFGTRRINVDRVQMEGTDHPWIYGSQVKGITALTMDMIYHHPQRLLLAVPAEKAPVIDGELNDSCWDGFGALPVQERNAFYYLRQDNTNLYVGYEQKLKQDPRGETTGKKAPTKADGDMRISFRNENGLKIATFSITGNGIPHTGLLDFFGKVPACEKFTVDGKSDGWKEQLGAHAAMIHLQGEASVWLAWNHDGLAILAEINKEGSSEANMNGLTLLAMKPGAADSLQLNIDIKSGAVHVQQWRNDKLGEFSAKTAVATNDRNLLVAALMPWDALGVKAEPSAPLALFARQYEPAHAALKTVGAPWNIRHYRADLAKADHALFLRLSNDPTEIGTVIETERRHGDIGYPFNDFIRVLKDSADWKTEWQGKTKKSEDGIQGEMAIPWSSLGKAGIDRANLEVEVQHPTRWNGPQEAVLRDFGRSATDVQVLQTPPEGTFIVRLHFAELDDISVGERVFNVELQGKTVLTGFDVLREAGKRYRAIVREFTVRADKTLDLKFIPKSVSITERSAPILNAFELKRQ